MGLCPEASLNVDNGLRIKGCREWAQGSGLRAVGNGLRAQGSGVRAQGSGLRAQGQGSGLRAQGSGLRLCGDLPVPLLCSGLRAQGSGCVGPLLCLGLRAQGSGCVGIPLCPSSPSLSSWVVSSHPRPFPPRLCPPPPPPLPALTWSPRAWSMSLQQIAPPPSLCCCWDQRQRGMWWCLRCGALLPFNGPINLR